MLIIISVTLLVRMLKITEMFNIYPLLSCEREFG